MVINSNSNNSSDYDNWNTNENSNNKYNVAMDPQVLRLTSQKSQK